MTVRPVGLTVLAILVVAAACEGVGSVPRADGPGTSAWEPTATQLNVAPASFDLAVGDDQRFLAGLFASDRNLILGGEVEMQFLHLGEDQATAAPGPVATTTGTFLPVPGKEPSQPLDAPTVIAPADASGVYESTVDLDRPGIWEVRVSLQLDDGQRLQGTGTFMVAEEPQVPTVGDPAPAVDNLTVESEAPPVAIDSRAQGDDDEVPDPQLHDTTVATALERGRPVVVVVSTPTYCVSQFCGPITETVESLADRHGDVAEFVHLEVWRDFDAGELNDAAAAWIQTERGGNEPWVFLVGADGTIQARWDNVLDEAQLVETLDGLAVQ